MRRVLWLPILGLGSLLAIPHEAHGQATPYIGFVYPAGGQQNTTFQVKLGGQRLDNVDTAIVSGTGVQAKVVRYYRKLGAQELTLLREQLRELRRGAQRKRKPVARDEATQELIGRIEKRIAESVPRPACASLSSLVEVEVTIAADASPGPREIRLATLRGVSNPLVFHVGQLPEFSRKPMITCPLQVLGKEQLALRKRPAEEEESQVTVPCTLNGQIASGEVNRYRFEAHKGQRLVISADARELIPYIADAVPGWFQPVLTLCDAGRREVAYNDDYRFKPDPTILFEVPDDGEYVLSITDAIYRGREDFVYRITVGEVPFLTSIFPLGGRVGEAATVEMRGWNLQAAKLALPPDGAGPGIHRIHATNRQGLVSNPVPFALDTLPECFDEESNDDQTHAQKVQLPTIVNGHMDRPDDWDVYQVEGRAGETLVAEVHARRLDSPMDSLLKLTDATGKLLAFNDDHEDPGTGLNTHHADSYLMVELPADGTYYVHLGDTARSGGEAYAYRLRISAPQPAFALRVVPSSAALRGRSSTAVNVYAIRKDGFEGAIKLGLKDPPDGFSSSTVTLPNDKENVRLRVKTTLAQTDPPVGLSVEGRAMIQGREMVHEAVPAEDRMQAFLWRHLVPAEELKVLVFSPGRQPPPKRVPPPPAAKDQAAVTPAAPAAKPTFTKRQVAGRLRQLKLLYEEWLLTDDFYSRKVAECEAAL
ncbi:MAG: pre-peptidase C-terminal domain-containing protein [Pirellulales bacterium]|nr:pre-peptidase C-terminal domain-containing protein [Pirellulales bacterium]